MVFMRHEGFINEEKSYSVLHGDLDASRIHPTYLAYNPNFVDLPVPLTHGYMRTTWRAMARQLKLFDHKPLTSDFPYEEVQWAKEQVINLLRSNGVKSKILALEDVEFNMQARNGFGFSDYKDKKSYLLNNEVELQDFWDSAHELGCEMLWSLAGKEEYQKWKKIINEDQRCFEIPPTTFLAYSLRVVQHFNKALYAAFEDIPIKVGVSVQKGGLDKLLRSVDLGGPKFMGDVTKWDKYFPTELRNCCRDIRLALYDGDDKAGYAQRLNYVYECCIDTPVITPWRQVIRIPAYMKSGDPSTTPDNSLAHLIIMFAYVKRFIPSVFSYHQVLQVFNMAIYADDHVGSVSDTLAGRFLLPFPRRKRFYRRCGFILKEEDDKVVEHGWVGLTFLGGAIVKHGAWLVPKYDLGRIWSSIILTNNSKIHPMQYYMKVYSLLILSTFNGPVEFEKIRLYLEFIVDHYNDTFGYGWLATEDMHLKFDLNLTGSTVRVNKAPLVPSYSWCVTFWIGYECELTPQPHSLACKNIGFILDFLPDFKLPGDYLYAGPGYSDGKYQDSVESFTPGKNLIDSAAHWHDAAYARAEEEADLYDADIAFFKELFGRGLKESLVAIPVGLQAMTRSKSRTKKDGKAEEKKIARKVERDVEKKQSNDHRGRSLTRTRRSRGRGRTKSQKSGKSPIVYSGAPVALGHKSGRGFHTVRSSNGGTKLNVSGRVWLQSIKGSNVAGTLLFGVNLNPQLMGSTPMAVYAKMFEQFKIKKLAFAYVPTCPTSTTGTISMFIDPDPQDPTVPVADTTRMREESVFTSWTENTVWKGNGLVPNLSNYPLKTFYSDVDYDDIRFTSMGNFYVRATDQHSTTGTIGSVYVEYEVEFYKPDYRGAILSSLSEWSGGTGVQVDTYQDFMGKLTTVDNSLAATLVYDSSAQAFTLGNLVPGYYNLMIRFVCNGSTGGAIALNGASYGCSFSLTMSNVDSTSVAGKYVWILGGKLSITDVLYNCQFYIAGGTISYLIASSGVGTPYIKVVRLGGNPSNVIYKSKKTEEMQRIEFLEQKVSQLLNGKVEIEDDESEEDLIVITTPKKVASSKQTTVVKGKDC